LFQALIEVLRLDSKCGNPNGITVQYHVSKELSVPSTLKTETSANPVSQLSHLPLLPEVGILALVPERWSEQWQPRHQVLTRLARYFHVTWMNPAPPWSEAITQAPVLRRPCTGFASPPGFLVYTPEFWLPTFYRPPFLQRFSLRARLRRAHHLLVRQGCRKLILYLWRHEFRQALAELPSDLSCYHIDDEYSFSPIELPVGEAESSLLAEVDQVFIHSPGLLEKKGRMNPNTLFVPNGVDYQQFANNAPAPADLAAIPHPRIGYVGWLKKQLNWTLLLRLARENSQWSFVFIGGQRPHPEIVLPIKELSSLPNVYFLGLKSTQELPSYPQHLDVCVMPYKADDYTKYIYPLKLHEYLAGGRPTVGTKIRSLEEFSRVVAVAETFEEWQAALVEALSPESNSPRRRAARQSVARDHDWNNLVAKIAETMAERLGSSYLDQFLKSTQNGLEWSCITKPQHELNG
jgi:glycosyltransferase involved in cell wall biosynthesis